MPLAVHRMAHRSDLPGPRPVELHGEVRLRTCLGDDRSRLSVELHPERDLPAVRLNSHRADTITKLVCRRLDPAEGLAEVNFPKLYARLSEGAAHFFDFGENLRPIVQSNRDNRSRHQRLLDIPLDNTISLTASC